LSNTAEKMTWKAVSFGIVRPIEGELGIRTGIFCKVNPAYDFFWIMARQLP